MSVRRRRRSQLDFDTVDEAAEFWGTRSVADLETELAPVDVEFRITRSVQLLAVDPILARELRRLSRARGLSPETVANLWLRERLAVERRPRRSKHRAA